MRRGLALWPGGALAACSLVVLLAAGPAGAEEDEKEHLIAIEIGPAGEWPLGHERSNYGGVIGAESEPIENWLEVEADLTLLGTNGRRELSGDFIVKKPWHVSPTIELEAGLGPSLSKTLNRSESGGPWGIEFAAEFIYWHDRDIGWFVEPAWTVAPGTGRQSVGVSTGLLIGVF
jgi:hypothetical protein